MATAGRSAVPEVAPVFDFVVLLGLSHLGSLLVVTGVAHVGGLPRLVDLLGRHGIIAQPLVRVVAVAVPSVELTIAALAVLAIAVGGAGATAAALAGGFAVGLLFIAYLWRLMRTGSDVDCGCTPLEGPLTSASFAPAASLVVTCGLGLLALLVGGVEAMGLSPWPIVPIVWGPVLAMLVILIPATVPVAASHRSRVPVAPGMAIGRGER